LIEFYFLLSSSPLRPNPILLHTSQASLSSEKKFISRSNDNVQYLFSLSPSFFRKKKPKTFAFSEKHIQAFIFNRTKTTTNSIKSNFAIKILFYGLFNNERQKFLLLKNVVVSLEFRGRILKGSDNFYDRNFDSINFFFCGDKNRVYIVKLRSVSLMKLINFG
jgi:hypothetical protein